MRTAIYTRISLDRDGEALGVERQEADCRALAERLGWHVVNVYSDNDTSAYSRRPRPAYRDMLAAIERGEVEAVVAYRSDRLYRSVFVDLAELVDVVQRHGLAIRTVASGEIDLGSADGIMMAQILASVAEGESRRMGERVRRQRLTQVSEGRRQGGGRRPYGWTSSAMTEQVPLEADVIREAVHRLLTGETLYQVTSDLNRRGITTAEGNNWKPAHMARLLRRPTLAGIREHAPSGTRTRGAWDPIITEDEHRLIVARLTSTSNSSGPRVSRRTGLLSGIVRCAACGHKLVHSATERRYVCSPNIGGCGVVRVNNGRALEATVLELSWNASLNNDRAPRVERASETTAALEEMTALDEREATLTDMLATGELDRGAYTRARRVVTDRRAELEAVLRDANEPTDEFIEQRFEAQERFVTGETMRAEDIAVLQPIIMRTLGESVWVQPRPRRSAFDPSCVTLTRDA